MTLLASWQARMRAGARYLLRRRLFALILLGSTYLSMVNLDYAHYWHDEGNSVAVARNLLEHGSLTGWDGRSLVAGTNGKSLNADLLEYQPPLQYFVTAASITLFGDSPAGARALHALAGVLALVVFWLLLQRYCAREPRLALLAFAFMALAAQLLLFYRHARYFGMALLLFMLLAYLQRRYVDSGRPPRDMALLFLTGLLGVFNNYLIGVAAIAAIATHHLIWHGRETSMREYLLLGTGAIIAVLIPLAWLIWLGGFEREGGLLSFSGVDLKENKINYGFIVFFRLESYMRNLFISDWLGWWISIWFVGCLAWSHRLRHSAAAAPKGKAKSKRRQPQLQPPPGLRPVLQLVLLGLLMTAYSALFSVQPSFYLAYADSRYLFMAIPMLLTMKALFVDWLLLNYPRVLGIAAAIVLMSSSYSAYPFNMQHLDNYHETLDFHLLSYIREVHRPYHDPVSETLKMLEQHVPPEGIVYTPNFFEHDALVAAAGDRYRFCCQLQPVSDHARAMLSRIDDPVQGLDPMQADWIVVYLQSANELETYLRMGFRIWSRSFWLSYPTQRPELNYHLFNDFHSSHEQILLLRNMNPRS